MGEFAPVCGSRLYASTLSMSAGLPVESVEYKACAASGRSRCAVARNRHSSKYRYGRRPSRRGWRVPATDEASNWFVNQWAGLWLRHRRMGGILRGGSAALAITHKTRLHYVSYWTHGGSRGHFAQSQ